MNSMYDELFEEIMDIIWKRGDQCTSNTINEELDPSLREYLGVLNLAYMHIWEDIRQLRRDYNNRENNNK